MIELAETAPAGCRGVVFTPWLNGAQGAIADAAARAGFHNVALDTGLPELTRAVLEGVAVQNALLLGVVEKFVGQRLDPIRIVGGGARSDLWCQIHADALVRTLERPADPLNAGLRGAALNAAVAIGALSRADLHDRVKVGTTFRPDPTDRELYDRLARRPASVAQGPEPPAPGPRGATGSPADIFTGSIRRFEVNADAWGNRSLLDGRSGRPRGRGRRRRGFGRAPCGRCR